jgi:hypothetical protein
MAEFSRRLRRFGQTSEQVAGEGVQDPALERTQALAPKSPWAAD